MLITLAARACGRRRESCILCGLCVALGCPALIAGSESIEISSDCTGCGVCLAVCARGAISLPVAAGADGEAS